MNPLIGIDGRSHEQKVEEAIEFLVELGFVVRPPLGKESNVTTPAGLVKFFYNRMAYYSSSKELHYVPDKKRDLQVAKQFIESRRSTGVSRGRAIAECCELVEILFKHESFLNLNFKVSSMSVLGQDKMAWVTEKLVTIYNGFNKEVEDSKERVWLENLYSKQELDISEEQIKAANKRLGLEDDNG